MRAYVLTEEGPAFRDIAEPQPKPGQVLVRVGANALNRADLGMAAGHLHGNRGGVGAVLGLEWAGEVVGLGEGVTDIALGERVMGTGGGFAELVAVAASQINRLPDANMSFEEATCYPVALSTMHNALVTAGGLRAGETVLIQGASSGVGLLGMQIARRWARRRSSAPRPTRSGAPRLGEFGADLAIDTGDPAWVQQVLDFTDGKGVDLIVDQVSGPLVTANMRATRILGRIVNVGRLGGLRSEFDADLHALRRITYTGVTFRTRTAAEVDEINRAMTADLWGHLTARRLRLPIDRVFPFEDASAALERMKANQHFGKIVLRH
jgi:NADPH2:quinone reductase